TPLYECCRYPVAILHQSCFSADERFRCRPLPSAGLAQGLAAIAGATPGLTLPVCLLCRLASLLHPGMPRLDRRQISFEPGDHPFQIRITACHLDMQTIQPGAVGIP